MPTKQYFLESVAIIEEIETRLYNTGDFKKFTLQDKIRVLKAEDGQRDRIINDILYSYYPF